MSAQSANNSVTCRACQGAEIPRSMKFGKWLLIFVLVFGAFGFLPRRRS
jgi:hypothetical protein